MQDVGPTSYVLQPGRQDVFCQRRTYRVLLQCVIVSYMQKQCSNTNAVSSKVHGVCDLKTIFE